MKFFNRKFYLYIYILYGVDIFILKDCINWLVLFWLNYFIIGYVIIVYLVVLKENSDVKFIF